MELGQSIKRIRVSRGYSQEELAIYTELAQNVISRIERDQHKPSDQTLKKLAMALKVEPDVFYYLSILVDKKKTKLGSLKLELSPLIENEISNLFSLDMKD
jgi:transcriptional regulator with XRE-family HTH domain